MTIYGLDVSHFQANLNLARAKTQGYSFVIAKCTEGRGYTDASYHSFKDQAQKADLPFAAYHFLRSDSPIAVQAANLAAHIGDKSVPVWIDCEPSGSSKPTIKHCEQFIAETHKLGIRVVGLYYPGFWWNQSGKPKLPLDLGFWQARYPKTSHDYGSNLYPGDKAVGWAAQGGQAPDIYQFASTAKIDGYVGNVDVNAYRGDVARLVATKYVKDWTPTVVKPPVVVPPPVHPPTPHPAGGVLTEEDLHKIATAVAAKLKVTT